MVNDMDNMQNILDFREAILKQAKEDFLELTAVSRGLKESDDEEYRYFSKEDCRQELLDIERFCLSDDFETLVPDLNIEGSEYLNLLHKSAEVMEIQREDLSRDDSLDR